MHSSILASSWSKIPIYKYSQILGACVYFFFFLMGLVNTCTDRCKVTSKCDFGGPSRLAQLSQQINPSTSHMYSKILKSVPQQQHVWPSTEVIVLFLFCVWMCLNDERSRWVTVFVVDQISLEGMVVHRAECRPVVNDNYMKLKKWVNLWNRPVI